MSGDAATPSKGAVPYRILGRAPISDTSTFQFPAPLQLGRGPYRRERSLSRPRAAAQNTIGRRVRPLCSIQLQAPAGSVRSGRPPAHDCVLPDMSGVIRALSRDLFVGAAGLEPATFAL